MSVQSSGTLISSNIMKTSMITALVLAAAAFPLPAAAQVSALSNTEVVTICLSVAEQMNEVDETVGTRFHYQTRLFRAAGVDPRRDSADQRRDRMQWWWSAHQSQLHCNLLNSTVSGNILKLAIDRSSNEFINDVVRRWGVDLNYRERQDGTTVLDFIESELIKAAGTPREAILRRYQRLFVENGAKRGTELPNRAWGS